jgi:hypothetical protein
MRKFLFVMIVAVPCLVGQASERQVRYSSGSFTLTKPSSRSPHEIAFGYLSSSAAIAPDDLPSVYLAKEYRSAHNGVTHLVYKQRFQDIPVNNAAWVANVGADGAVLSAGGKLYPSPGPIDFGSQLAASAAVRAAVGAVNPHLAAKYVPTARSSTASYQVRFAAGDLGADIEGRLAWYAHRDKLLLAWLFNIVDEDGVSSYDVAVEAATGAIIDQRATTFFQSAPSGLVFDQGWPQPNPSPGLRLNAAPPIVQRKLLPLSGDLVASPNGWVLNNETAGYNAIVSENPLGQAFLLNAIRTQATNGSFMFPLNLGPSAPNPLTYRDAANVNLFYWVNRVHDFFYGYGFDEAAGNFQSNNYSRGGVDGDALLAYTHYGAAATGTPALNNAFFTARSVDDGSPSMIAMYATISGPAGFFADGAYAADVITHEYTHGVSLRLLPDGYGSFQTAAMGEAWSDFFGLDFTTPSGSPVDGSYPVGEYWIQSWGTGIRTRPYSTQTSINPLTFADLGRVYFGGPEVHADGEIWVEALWDARANLIQQFGETAGRNRMRQLVIDGLMLSTPSPSMTDARDAILLADRVDFDGESQNQLWAAFAKRGLGALAHSDGGDTVHIIPSSDMPSPTGKLKFYEDTFVAGEPVRLLLSDSNLSDPSVSVQITTTSGDVENLTLDRWGSLYYGWISSSTATVTQQNGFLSIIPGDVITASYMDQDRGPRSFLGSGGPLLIQATAATQQPYALVTSTTPSTGLPTFPNEVRLTNVRSPVIVTMPFDFPFFSKKYRSMVVLPTGAIVFEPSVFTSLLGPGCNDTTELSRIAAIAPLFANLTFGSAQPNEGVFLSSSGNTLAVRWTAEVLPATPLLGPSIPEPVNFAAAFTTDGVVTFYYGSGNQNLQTAAQTLTTCGPQPAVGLSNGHDVYARSITLRTYNNAPTVSFYPAFNASTTPEVSVERPTAGETVQSILRVSGIAYEPGLTNLTFLSRRDVFIDGIARAILGASVRADYCATNPVPGCPAVGFQSDLNIATLGLAPGSHTLFVRATNTRGGFKDSAPVSFNINPGTARLPKAAIETPVAGTELSGTVTFSGYAYADDLRVIRVDLLIDGVTYPGTLGSAYGLTRADVCGPLPTPAPPNCPSVGWSVSVNTRTGAPPLPDGQHSMQLRVLDETGRTTLLPSQPVPFSVKNGPQTFPTGAISSVKPGDRLSGIISVSGYAYSPGGRVTSVVVLMDGLSVALAPYGQPRPDDCAKLPDVSACPNIGFSANFDTRPYVNGSHILGVRIVNDAGLSVIVPNLVGNGMNVTVDNH